MYRVQYCDFGFNQNLAPVQVERLNQEATSVKSESDGVWLVKAMGQGIYYTGRTVDDLTQFELELAMLIKRVTEMGFTVFGGCALLTEDDELLVLKINEDNVLDLHTGSLTYHSDDLMGHEFHESEEDVGMPVAPTVEPEVGVVVCSVNEDLSEPEDADIVVIEKSFPVYKKNGSVRKKAWKKLYSYMDDLMSEGHNFYIHQEHYKKGTLVTVTYEEAE